MVMILFSVRLNTYSSGLKKKKPSPPLIQFALKTICYSKATLNTGFKHHFSSCIVKLLIPTKCEVQTVWGSVFLLWFVYRKQRQKKKNWPSNKRIITYLLANKVKIRSNILLYNSQQNSPTYFFEFLYFFTLNLHKMLSEKFDNDLTCQ